MSFERNGRVMSHLILQTAGGETRTVELDGGILENRGSHRTDELYINTGATGTFYLNERGEVWVPAFGAASFVSAERNQTLVDGTGPNQFDPQHRLVRGQCRPIRDHHRQWIWERTGRWLRHLRQRQRLLRCQCRGPVQLH